MPEPITGYNYVEHIIQFIKDVAPFGSAIWISAIFINKVFKYKSEQRRAEIEAIVEEKVTPTVDRLEKSISDLTKSIGALERKIT